MLPSDPEPKATSVPPTTFKVGDRVRLKSRPDYFYTVLNVGPGHGSGSDGSMSLRIGLLTSGGHETWDWERNLELVPDAPSPFKLGDRNREPVKVESNNVDHPSHYTAGSIETITAIEAMVGQKGWSPLTGYRLGNVLKYLWRHAAKGGVESLKKAAWYLDREIEAQEAGK